MKYALLCIIVFMNIGFAQSIPYSARITLPKDSVLSTEIFTVKYALTDIEGYIYVGIMDEYFEIVGNDSWEGEVMEGDTVCVFLKLRLKESAKEVIDEHVPLSIGFSNKPIDEMAGGDRFQTVIINIIDYAQLKHKYITIKRKSLK